MRLMIATSIEMIGETKVDQDNEIVIMIVLGDIAMTKRQDDIECSFFYHRFIRFLFHKSK